MILLTILHVSVCLFLIVIVLLQHGKGADIGATFGGSSQTVFGSRGAATFLSKTTVAAAVIFMLTSLGLAVLPNWINAKSVFSDEKPLPKGSPTAAVAGGAPSVQVEVLPAAEGSAAPAGSAKFKVTGPSK